MRRERPTKREQATIRPALFASPRSRSVNTPDVRNAHGWLTFWLNAERDLDADAQRVEGYSSESKERILGLLALVSATVKKVQAQRGDIQYSATFTDITEAMRPYTAFPTLAYVADAKTWIVIRELPEDSRFPARETMAAHGLLELARHECLDRIRHCDCGRWYFALRDDGVACSDTCRKRIHERTPEAKAKRRQRLQDNAEYNTGKIFLKGKHAKSSK